MLSKLKQKWLKPHVKKEYMKYEDGRIVSVKQEHDETEPSLDKDKIKSQTKDAIRYYGLKKWGLRLGIIFFLILFILTAIDVYQTVLGDNDNVVAPTTDTTSPAKDHPNHVTYPASEKTWEDKQVLAVSEVVSTTGHANQLLLDNFQSVIRQLEKYTDGFINQRTVLKRLKNERDESQLALAFTNKNKALYEDGKATDLLTATEKRVRNVKNLIESLIEDIEQGKTDKALYQRLTDYVVLERTYKDTQQSELETWLTAQGVTYTQTDKGLRITQVK